MIAESVGALVGVAAAPVLRGAAARLAVPWDEPVRRCACGRTPGWLPPSGRCPRCATAIGPAPLAVELVAAGAGAAVGAAADWPAGPVLAWVALLGVVLAFVDTAVHRLPDLLTLPLAGGTAALLLAAGLLDHRTDALTRSLYGALACLLLYGLLALLGPLGGGDVKLAPTLGALLAWYGWRPLLQGTMAAFLLAAAWGVVLLLTGRAKAKDPLPFGPCMLLGALLGVLTAG
ncbi:prepilin peptidase [Kitasatospora viridis]|uniref:Leader peptidase (Prepilin peptidase)/N-methyltransferase n=1 Tax=Kitasatospora viridis TaxID=281105 RepID=A0A561UFL9_9ACTN|nr:prepilin peptidase [Kitasatospora viridis]TWF98167.1 leader peptidase (prepilin peptidase)/N-methyltransferase [Kitasatospora viridis]